MKMTINNLNRMMDNKGNLDLRKTLIVTLPEDLTVGGSLDLYGTKIKSLPKNLTVGGNLFLGGTPIETLPEDLTVGGGIYLLGTPIETLPDGLKVGGNLDLEGTKIVTLPEGLTVGGNLDLEGTPIEVLPDNLKVGGNLYLAGTKIKTLPEDLTVGGNLYLEGTEIKTLPKGLVVGGYLYLEGTPIETLPEDLMVGKDVYPRREYYAFTKLEQGDCVAGEYLFADGILTHIRAQKKVGDYTLYVGKISNRNVVYDGKYYAHCKTLHEGIADILFKHAKDRGSGLYKKYRLDDTIKTEEAITMYRIVTGACQQGTQRFVDALGDKLKKCYTVREIIDLTSSAYGGNSFKEFFES